MNYSAQVYQLMDREFGEVCRFILEKQCQDISLNPNRIEGKDLPRLSRILSGRVSKFGEERARRLGMELNNLRAAELESEDLEEQGDVPKLFTQDSGAQKSRTSAGVIDVSRKLAKKNQD